MGCKGKLSSTCGKKHNAKCVDYEGELHENTQLEDCGCYNVEEVIEDLNSTINTIMDSIDLSGLGNLCITYDLVDGVITVKEALAKIEAKLCELADAVELDPPDCPTIFTEDISCLQLDFECLTDPCNNQITNLKDLLQAMITQICQNKTDIANYHVG